MIDKSLRQYYENGKEVDPYRKGLEIIAGKGKDTIQTTAPGKITARNLIKPAEKMTLPSVRKDKTVPSITTLPKTARPSFDQKKYSGLASALMIFFSFIYFLLRPLLSSFGLKVKFFLINLL